MKCHIYDVSYTEMTTNTRYIQECMTTEWSGPWSIILYYPRRIVIGIMSILHKNRITSILFGSPHTNDDNIGPLGPRHPSPDLSVSDAPCTEPCHIHTLGDYPKIYEEDIRRKHA